MDIVKATNTLNMSHMLYYTFATNTMCTPLSRAIFRTFALSALIRWPSWGFEFERNNIQSHNNKPERKENVHSDGMFVFRVVNIMWYWSRLRAPASQTGWQLGIWVHSVSSCALSRLVVVVVVCSPFALRACFSLWGILNYCRRRWLWVWVMAGRVAWRIGLIELIHTI